MIARRHLLGARAGLLMLAFASGNPLAQERPADREDMGLAYAQCIRDNGYAEFPDPMPDGGIRFQITPDTAPRFQKAAEHCRHLAPEGMRGEQVTPEQLDALVELSRCVRENGVPEFPDPNAEGAFNLSGVSSGPDDPRIAAAMEACRGKAQGTRVMIGG